MSKKMITLRSSDQKTFEIDEAVALQSQTLKHLIDDGCTQGFIPLPNVNGKTLAKVIEFLNKHYGEDNNKAKDDDEREPWDEDFVKVDNDTLFDLIHAADYLSIKKLMDLTCQTVAEIMKSKTPEEIRKTFHIKNDYTPEEEAEIRRENQWAFDY